MLSRDFFVTTERLVLRDDAQETDFVLDTFVVFTNTFHQPTASVDRDLRVECLLISADTLDVARRPEEVRHIFNLEEIADVKSVECTGQVLLV